MVATTTYQDNDITTILETIKTKDLGMLSWHDAMAAVENDPTWRLPTIHELEWMVENQDKIDEPFLVTNYWSSTTASSTTNACGLNFDLAAKPSSSKTAPGRVRAVRRDQFDNLAI